MRDAGLRRAGEKRFQQRRCPSNNANANVNVLSMCVSVCVSVCVLPESPYLPTLFLDDSQQRERERRTHSPAAAYNAQLDASYGWRRMARM